MIKISDVIRSFDIKKRIKVLRITKEEFDLFKPTKLWYKNIEFQDLENGLKGQRVVFADQLDYDKLKPGHIYNGEVVEINGYSSIVRFYWDDSIRAAIISQKYKYSEEDLEILLKSPATANL